MSLITTGSNPKLLRPGLFSIAQASYDEYGSFYDKMFDVHPSDMKYEEIVGYNTFGLAQVKEEGSAPSFGTTSQAFTTRAQHDAYSLGFIVTHEEKMDNLYDQVSMGRAAMLGSSFKTTKETVAANVYLRAETSGYTFGDGKTLLATDHPTITGNQSNKLATAADFSEASLEDLLIIIGNAVDNAGNRKYLRAVRLITSTNLQFDVTRVLESELQPDTANNNINAVKLMGVIPEAVFNPYLSDDTDAWFIRTNVPSRTGLILFEREKFQLNTFMSTDGSMSEKTIGYERYKPTCGDWRAIYGSMGA